MPRETSIPKKSFDRDDSTIELSGEWAPAIKAFRLHGDEDAETAARKRGVAGYLAPDEIDVVRCAELGVAHTRCGDAERTRADATELLKGAQARYDRDAKLRSDDAAAAKARSMDANTVVELKAHAEKLGIVPVPERRADLVACIKARQEENAAVAAPPLVDPPKKTTKKTTRKTTKRARRRSK